MQENGEKSKNKVDFRADKLYALGISKNDFLQEGFYMKKMDRPNGNSNSGGADLL